MEHQKSERTQSAIWLVALSLCSATLIFEASAPSLSPLVTPFVCAAFLGTLLPAAQFRLLVGLVVCCTLLPLLVYPGSPLQLSHRIIGVACVVLIAVFHRGRSTRSNGEDSTEFEQSLLSKRENDNLSDAAISSTTSIGNRATRHQCKDERGAEFSFDMIAHEDHLLPILEHLETDGKFDADQMQLIENALRTLDGHNVNYEFAASLEKGMRIGRFIVEEPLGRGGEGHVYRGHDTNGKPAAIKILHNMRVSDRFRREMHMVRQLAHPNIVTAYEVGEFQGLPFITMELLSGPDLHVMVRDSGKIDWQLSTQYILQATRALSHAHRRDLVHRDIKPGNLIMHGSQQIKIVDLGLAAMSTTDSVMESVFHFETQEGHLAGTLPFMAPEQARSLANATVRSDIYGLGATWFFLLTGKDRLCGKSFAEQFENLLVHRRFNALNPGLLPKPLERIFDRMVAYSPNDRYRNCDQLAEDLESALIEVGETVAMVKGIEVLVVEDSRTDMIMTLEILKRANSTLAIHQARTLAEGLQICQERSIDLVLLDLSLPDSSGVSTVRRFRETCPDSPLVVLTGLSQDEAAEECIDAGADTFVCKSGLSAHRMERVIFVTLSRFKLTEQP